jgi:hypothetical protein
VETRFDPAAKVESEDLALFPTQARILRWRTEPGFNERLSNICSELFESAIRGKRPYHTYNLWTYEYSELAQLRRMFAQAMKDYVEDHMHDGLLASHSYTMHAWLRIDRPAEVVPPHTHPDVNVVGTYYSRVEIADRGRGEGDLLLLDPRPGVKLGFEKSRDSTHSISPEPGMMVLIPCFLGHWVNPVSQGDKRICIANNLTLTRKVPLGISGSFVRPRVAIPVS